VSSLDVGPRERDRDGAYGFRREEEDRELEGAERDGGGAVDDCEVASRRGVVENMREETD
jgi:hypothetical protein